MLTKRFAQTGVHLAALASIPMLVQGFTRFENNILSLTQSVASITNNISNIEQAVGSLAARVAALEAGAASASSGSGSQTPGTCWYKAMDPQPLGDSSPMAQCRLMTVEIRGADLILSQALKMNMHGVPVFLRFPCEQYHTGITNWINAGRMSFSILFRCGPRDSW